MLSYFFEPATLDGVDVFVKWALRRKVSKSGIEISLSPSEILDSQKKKVLKERFVVEYDNAATSNNIKSIRMSRLERRNDVVVIKVFFSGFPNSPLAFTDEPEDKKPKRKKT